STSATSWRRPAGWRSWSGPGCSGVGCRPAVPSTSRWPSHHCRRGATAWPPSWSTAGTARSPRAAPGRHFGGCTSLRSRARWLVSAGLLALLAWRADWGQVAAAVAQLRPGWAVAAFAAYLLTQLVSASRWRLLARPLGFAHSRRQYAGMFYVGMYFNLFL